MATGSPTRFHVALNVTEMTDEAREDLVSGILEMAKDSVLYQNSPLIQAVVARVGTTHDTYKTAGNKAAATAAQLEDDEAEALAARKLNDKELVLLRGLVEADAKSRGDITGIALKPLDRGGRGARSELLPPEAIDIDLPKTAKGYLWASAHEAKGSQGKYAAQVAQDQNGPGAYENLPGFSKKRKLSGASGTR
jgi:hypothetical protein